ncbi:hypothetical protein ACFWZ2_18840 [Streptomyces sp. NPDC059002]|uniref:hypothetical protein n=1 Tax=Streptomyces sp. NPDC059002 TaxID=3346690 RepID=UPI003676D9B0
MTPRIAAATATAAATVLLSLAAGAGTPAFALDKPTEPGQLTLIDTPKGKALADKDGNPLYTRDADKPNTPDCTGDCATNWPAAIGYPTKADDVTGQTAQTEDNAQDADQPQVIYETRPLYYFKNDEKGQDPKGQDVAGWSLLGADGKELGEAAGDTTDESASPSPDATAPDGSASPDASKSPSTNTSANASATPLPTTPSTKEPSDTGSGTDTGTGTDTGALRATPSGAARGGADHASAADEHPEAGPLAFASAGVTGAAAGAGIWLLRRRRARDSEAEHR